MGKRKNLRRKQKRTRRRRKRIVKGQGLVREGVKTEEMLPRSSLEETRRGQIQLSSQARKREAAALRKREGGGAGASTEEKIEVGARIGKRGRRKARGRDRARGQFRNSKHVT